MSKTRKTRGPGKKQRHISVRGIRREQPDVRKLARVLIQLVQAQAEVDAAAEHTAKAGGGEQNTAVSEGSIGLEVGDER
jgi:predicted lactoylglutathione lyase